MTSRARPDRYVLRTVLIVALGGFVLGFDASVIAGVIPFVRREFALDAIAVGWAVASLTLAATVSIMLAGPVADRFGRRVPLLCAAMLFTVSALLAASAVNFGLLVVARLLSGLGVGAAIVVAPMYIAEISPAAVRGRMVSINQLLVVLGISAAFFSNYLILHWGQSELPVFSALRLAEWNWRWMFAVGAVPSLLLLTLLLTVPESPRWLAMRGRYDAARDVLSRAHGAVLAEAELAEVRDSLARAQGKGVVSPRELLAPELRRVLVIGLVVGIVQQATGINAVLFYAPVIFEHAGASEEAAFAQAVYLGLVNFVFSVVALVLMDRLGRRPLLMLGTGGMALGMAMLAWGFRGANMQPTLVLVGALTFVGSFAMSLGPIMWVLFAEIFPNRIRAVAISFVGLVNSLVSVGVQLVFPWELAHLGSSAPWLIYGGLALLGLLFIARQVPETRGRSLEDLAQWLVRRG
jgi:sugar porter (SP) family MFS transporter